MARYKVRLIGIDSADDKNHLRSFFDLEAGISCRFNIAKQKATFRYKKKLWNPQKIDKAVINLGFEKAKTIVKEKKKKMELHVFLLICSCFLAILPLYIAASYYFDWYQINEKGGLIANLICATLIQFGVGFYFYFRVFHSFKNKKIRSSFMLMLATSTMYIYSFANIINYFSNRLIVLEYNVHILFSYNALLFIIFLFSKSIEHSLASYTADYQKALSHFTIQEVRKITDSGIEKRAIEEIIVGDIILIEPNSQIPLEGIIHKGFSYFDESIVKGVSRPFYHGLGEKLSSGTVNLSNPIEIKVTAAWTDSLLYRVNQEVAASDNLKEIKNTIYDRIYNIMTPCVLLICLAGFLVNYLVLDKSWSESFNILLAMMIVSIPASLTLASSISVLVGMGKFDNAGISVRYRQAIDEAVGIQAAIFSHIGIVTNGIPWVKTYQSEGKLYDDILFSIERKSAFPLAKTIVNYLTIGGAKKIKMEIVELEQGRIKAIVGGNEYYCGSYAYAKEMLKDCQELEEFYSQEADEAQVMIFLIHNNRAVCRLAISDRMRETASPAVRTLKQYGIECFLMSSENEIEAKKAAKRIGLNPNNVFYNIVPTNKVECFTNIKEKYKEVMFIGDSINDAACLIRADVSICFDSADAVPIDSADILLQNDDLTAIPQIIRLSRKILINRQINILFGVAIPILLIPFAFFDLVNPIQAILSIVICQFLVSFNAIRIRQIAI